jgi:Ser-tRNA(Ala) deacylase AlaX
MPIKIYHPDHGFVFANQQVEIDALLAKGGKVVVKNKEVEITAVKHEEAEPKSKKDTDSSKQSHKWLSKN